MALTVSARREKGQLRAGQVVAAEILRQFFVRLDRGAGQGGQTGGQHVIDHTLRYVEAFQLLLIFSTVPRHSAFSAVRCYPLHRLFPFWSTGGLFGAFIRDILRELCHGKRFIGQNFEQQAERMLTGKLPAWAGAAAGWGFGIHKVDAGMVGIFPLPAQSAQYSVPSAVL